MQKFGWLEDLYMKWETDKINDLLALKEAMKKIDPAEYWIDEIESFDLDYYNDFVLMDAEEIVEANRILDKIENWEELTQAEKKDWDDFYDEDKNEWDKARILSFINEATRNLLDKISPEYVSEWGIEDIVDILREDLGKSKSKYSKDISDLWEVFDDLVERYWTYWRSNWYIGEEGMEELSRRKFERDMGENEFDEMPEEVYDQWEEVTTTPKKKTSKKQTENKVKLDTKKIASDYMKWDMDWNKYQHLAWLTEEQALEKRWKFETAIDEEWDKNQDYYNTHQSELVEKFHHLLK